LTACVSGFHMASFYEIFDMSNLRYDTARGMINSDSGNGPFKGLYGWVRTGGSESISIEPGIGNCDVWTSVSASDNGTLTKLSDDWANPMPWDTTTATCDLAIRVWCIED